jgi:arabinofuranan 3-O-arabinosyltransferase
VTLGPADPEGPDVEVDGSGRTSFDLTVEQASEPFWLVLGQSQSDGWEADVSGGSTAARSQLVDGYANGWLVEPDGDGPIEIRLRWTPQRVVWAGLALSAVGVVACLALACWPRRRPVVETTVERAPALASPFVSSGHRPGRVAVGVGAAGVAVGTALAANVFVGLLVGAVAAFALADRRARPVLTVGSVAALGGAALYVIANQLFDDFPAVPEWPSLFERAHLVALTAVLLLAADVVVEVIRTRPSRTRS